MKLNDAVAKVYAFLNKIALNIPIVSKLFKNRTAETSTAETTAIETAISETILQTQTLPRRLPQARSPP